MDYINIDGWFDFQQIYDMAIENAVDGDSFIEIGCYKGKSTAYLCDKITKSGKTIHVTVIDTFQHGTLSEFKDNVKYKYLTILQMNSNEAHKFVGSNSFIFVDGGHDYETVKADLNNFYGKITKGGMFAGHDYLEATCGVKKAVDEFCAERGLTVSVVGGSWVIR